MGMTHVELDEVVHLSFNTKDPVGGGLVDADSLPTCAIFEEDTDTAIRTPTIVKRTALTGTYRVSDTFSAANGYEEGKFYTIEVEATVNSVLQKKPIAQIYCAAAAGGGGGDGPDVLQTTTIATLASQTSFTLTAGSTDDDAYIGCLAVIEDASTSTQKCVGVVSDYVGSTKTITLLNDPGIFTIATTDNIDIIADRSLKPATDNRTATVSAAGVIDADVVAINTATAAAVRLALSAGQIIPGTVEDTTTSPTTTSFAAADITEATADHYNNRVILWTTGALIGSVAQITDYALTSGEGVFTVSTMTDTPADGDTFVII